MDAAIQDHTHRLQQILHAGNADGVEPHLQPPALWAGQSGGGGGRDGGLVGLTRAGVAV